MKRIDATASKHRGPWLDSLPAWAWMFVNVVESRMCHFKMTVWHRRQEESNQFSSQTFSPSMGSRELNLLRVKSSLLRH